MSQKRVCIYLDAGNFHYLALRKIKVAELDFDFEQFVQFLAQGREVVGKRFYVGTVREQEGDARSKEAMSRQTKLFTMLKYSGWDIKTSKLRKRMERIVIDHRVKNHVQLLKSGIREIEFERTREKGIDVKLATDLIVGAIDDQYDVAIVVSSDADLVPAIDWVRFRMKKAVEYLGFSIPDSVHPENSTRPLQTMISRTNVQRILVDSDLHKFVKPTQQKIV